MTSAKFSQKSGKMIASKKDCSCASFKYPSLFFWRCVFTTFFSSFLIGPLSNLIPSGLLSTLDNSF